MGDRSELARIEREVAALTPQEKLELVERIVHRLRLTCFGEKRDLDTDDLYGSGKHIWGDEDAQEYVNRMREDREFPPQ